MQVFGRINRGLLPGLLSGGRKPGLMLVPAPMPDEQAR